MMEQNKKTFKFNREDFNFFKIKEAIIGFFLSHSELLFMIFFVVITIMSSVIIYKYIYSSVWSNEQKAAYLQELKNGRVDFNLNNFNGVTEKSKEREIFYKKDIGTKVRDIFGIEK